MVASYYIAITLFTSKIIATIPQPSQEILSCNKPCILLFWHGRIAIMPAMIQRLYPKHIFAAVISQHNDGEYLSYFVKKFGHETIRGSSSRGGANAIAGIIAALRQKKSIAITPDGPRGPAMKIGGNVIALAQKYNLPILHICYSASRTKIFKSWDRFMLPLPFSRINLTCSEPWYCDHSENRDKLKMELEISMTRQQEMLDI